ncbi:MAG TPA: hypothetical protein VH353_09845 [Caulobacteraceae bacterium]|nr:hypothetical protein [Caulobacteraceae bacterium]
MAVQEVAGRQQQLAKERIDVRGHAQPIDALVKQEVGCIQRVTPRMGFGALGNLGVRFHNEQDRPAANYVQS